MLYSEKSRCAEELVSFGLEKELFRMTDLPWIGDVSLPRPRKGRRLRRASLRGGRQLRLVLAAHLPPYRQRH